MTSEWPHCTAHRKQRLNENENYWSDWTVQLWLPWDSFLEMTRLRKWNAQRGVKYWEQKKKVHACKSQGCGCFPSLSLSQRANQVRHARGAARTGYQAPLGDVMHMWLITRSTRYRGRLLTACKIDLLTCHIWWRWIRKKLRSRRILILLWPLAVSHAFIWMRE